MTLLKIGVVSLNLLKIYFMDMILLYKKEMGCGSIVNNKGC
mgnify:CR=1 FL=1